MAERVGERASEREEGDDRWGRTVSERARLGWSAGPRVSTGPRNAGERASASAGASARVGRAVGPSQREEESA
jgi:hypothetical protein